MPFASVRDLNMYYEVEGGGPRLLCVWGSGGDLRRKPNVFDSPLTAAFTVLAYDQRGLGRTEAPNGPYTVADYAEDANALLEAVGWQRCHVLGVSFGGMVAQEFAIRFPHRVERLLLACTSSGGEGGDGYPLHELAHLDMTDYWRQFLLLGDIRRNREWEKAHPEELQVLLQQARALAEVGAGEPKRAKGRRSLLEARRHHDTYKRLPALAIPVYVCGGKYDGIAPAENVKAIARQIVGARLEFFEGGHLFLREDPQAFQRVIAFLREELDMENEG